MGRFRPTTFPPEDRPFWGWLASWSAGAAVLGAWVALAPPTQTTVHRVPQRLQRYLVELPHPVSSRPAAPVVQDVPWRPGPPPAHPPTEPAPRREALVQRSTEGLLLSRLARRGAGAARILSSEDEAPPSLEALDVEVTPTSGLRRARAARHDQDIGVIERYEVGAVALVGTDSVLVPPVMERRAVTGLAIEQVQPREVPTADLPPLLRRLRYCIERRRRERPSLSGRWMLAWTLERHRATEVRLLEQPAADEPLEACLVQTLQRYRFSLEAGRLELPMVFVD